MPDTYKALRKQVQQETTQEFIVRQAGELLFVVVSRIAPAKSDFGDSPIVVGAFPSFVRIVAIHVFHDLERVRPQFLLVDDPVRADNERLDASCTILSRCRNQRESSDHYALNHIVQPAQRRSRTLPLEDLEVLAVIRLLRP